MLLIMSIRHKQHSKQFYLLTDCDAFLGTFMILHCMASFLELFAYKVFLFVLFRCFMCANAEPKQLCLLVLVVIIFDMRAR
jgi:hypothetical protein